jgi:heptosyltransferase-2
MVDDARRKGPLKILIVKHGALGDVVRTAYFTGPLRKRYGSTLELSWITAPVARELLANNPDIDRIFVDFRDIKEPNFDIVYSLDDEAEIISAVSRLVARRIVGAYESNGRIEYSGDSSAWFDMGLLSRYGKARADELKRLNTRTHADIFAEMFQVKAAEPRLYGIPALEESYRKWVGDLAPAIGINPHAGERWPAKELRTAELDALLRKLLGPAGLLSDKGGIVLLGGEAGYEKNLQIAASLAHPRVRVADTRASALHLAALIRALDCIVSSDSLAMHLAIAQGVPTVAFFTPTSAVEIDSFGCAVKVISTAPDYCSYRRDADNSTITHARLIEAIDILAHRAGLLPRGPGSLSARSTERG